MSKDDAFFRQQQRDPSKKTYSEGKIRPDDEGDIAMRVAADHEHHLVIIQFAKPVTWLGLPPTMAKAFAESLLEKVKEL